MSTLAAVFSGVGADDRFMPAGGIPLAPAEFMVRDSGLDPEDDRAGIASAIFAQLTPRQRLVSVWIAARFSIDEIARHLRMTQEELSSELGEIARVVRAIRL